MNVTIGALEFPAERLRCVHSHFAFALQQAHKVLATNKIQLARRRGLGSHFVVRSRNRGTQTQNLSRLSLLQDQHLPFLRRSRQLYCSRTENVNPPRSLPLDEQQRPGRHHAVVAGGVHRPMYRRRKATEKHVAAGFATRATLDHVQIIWSFHARLLRGIAPHSLLGRAVWWKSPL